MRLYAQEEFCIVGDENLKEVYRRERLREAEDQTKDCIFVSSNPNT
jgi:hypothetical protein